MKNYNAIAWIVTCALAFMVAATAAEAPPSTFKFKLANVPGAAQTRPGGVDNSGVIVGHYVDQSGVGHGYMLQGKNLTTLDDPSGRETTCIGINPNGAITVVGDYLKANTEPEGFLYKNGQFTDIPGPTGATSSSANGINDKGEIVGYYLDTRGLAHGFLLKGKTYTTLDVPGASQTFAAAINNHGRIVLFWDSLEGKGLESSLYDGKTYKTINVPGRAGSIAQGINTAGDVLYQWLDSRAVFHGALLHNGKFYKFDYPKSAETYSKGINDHGLITGAYQANSNGPYQGFKATYK